VNTTVPDVAAEELDVEQEVPVEEADAEPGLQPDKLEDIEEVNTTMPDVAAEELDVEQEVPLEEADAEQVVSVGEADTDVDEEATAEKSREFLLSEIGRLQVLSWIDSNPFHATWNNLM
jgi:hypothetical protein